jgi:DNA transformation protein
MNAEDRGFVEFVLDELSHLESVTARPMFGGYGLYKSSNIFGIVYDDRLYLKTNETTRGWYEEQGAETFRPNPQQHLKNYFEVPPAALEDPEVLGNLAEEAST